MCVTYADINSNNFPSQNCLLILITVFQIIKYCEVSTSKLYKRRNSMYQIHFKATLSPGRGILKKSKALCQITSFKGKSILVHGINIFLIKTISYFFFLTICEKSLVTSNEKVKSSVFVCIYSS